MAIKDLKLYSNMGPNPPKILILLQELGLPYETITKGFGPQPGGVKNPDFLAINPNGRVPALIDPNCNDLIVWESGAILIYLAQKYDTEHKFYPASVEEQAIVNTWIMYQVSGQGPTQGQVVWFKNYDTPKGGNVGAIERYTAEIHRIYQVFDAQLEKEGGYTCLGKYTIADIAWYTWIRVSEYASLDLSSYKNITKWKEMMDSRPAVIKTYSS